MATTSLLITESVARFPLCLLVTSSASPKQTVEDPVQQYKRDRDPREKLFEFGRCVVHFAVNDEEPAA